MSSKSGKKINRKRFVYSIMPLLAMLVAIAAINWFSPAAATPSPTASAAATVPTQQSDLVVATLTRPPILLATILPSPTPTITPLPQPPAEATITLLGPPAESGLPTDGRIAFYWTYSEPLLTGQALVLTVHQNELILATSSLSAPNFGTAYQVWLDVAEVAEEGTAVWQVHLQWQDDTQALLSSENRSLTLLEN